MIQKIRVLLKAQETIQELRRQNERLVAIVEDKLAETKLVTAGPSGDGFGIDLMDGPVPYLAEYMMQMLKYGKADGEEPSNYCEIEIRHKDGTRMALTLQRVHGLTPNQKEKAAVARAEQAEAELRRLTEQLQGQAT